MSLLTKHIAAILSAVLFIIGLSFVIAPVAHAEEHWIRIDKVTDRTKITDDIVTYTTVWYKSGTTKPGRKGQMIVKPLKMGYRYIDYRNNSCDKAVAELDYISYRTKWTAGNVNQTDGARRIACNPNGQDSFTFKLKAPTMKYFKDGMAPRFITNVHVALKNWDDKNDTMSGRLWWLKLSTPTIWRSH